MSNFALDGSLMPEPTVRLTDNTLTNIYTAAGATALSAIICAPNSGTPTCTLSVVDESGTARVLWTATTPFIFSEYYPLPARYSIKAQSSDASGHVDVHVVHAAPAAARQRGP
jgi:hypothetical protein